MVFQRFLKRLIDSVEKRQAQQLEEAQARLELVLWQSTGGKLSEQEAEALEKSLSSNQRNLKTHTLLIGYYRKNNSDNNNQKCSVHQLWIIENEPRCSIINEACNINDVLAPDAFEKGRKLWLKHLKRYPKDPKILMNAAEYFSNSDEDFCESLLLKGKELQPGNPEWSEKLARLYRFRLTNEEVVDLAKAFKEQEMAYKLAKSSSSALRYLEDVPRYAFEAGEFKAARKHCEKLLELAKKKHESEKSHCFHSAYTTLGRLELQNNNISKAKEYLLKSAEVSGSPVLNSFGPSLLLAKDLFDKNEKDIVIEYLKLCSKFWHQANKNLDDWTNQIRKGKFPDQLVIYR